ncbi:phosphoglycolate phosphatase [Caminibacter mediatlanticus TB-2]|uniref:phosphoglycolate phosphatase n=1 Tax=Caminibacter mediatlanticus TB-2 TaxID=391592 RepID=A0ABX5VA53_9BACT|nr:phosphoglycolate phosphatase [Caminibacter mediatlanticus]QCT93681.1 phosphoglycolate phosphatase [Caminibacter mediatlanticus TB-2]
MLLLFDLDGTLIDSAKDLATSINYMLKTLNKKTYDEKIITKWIGNGGEVLIKRALSGGMEIKEIDEKEFLKAKEIFFNHYKNNLANNTTIYDGVIETLKNLPYKKVIITNKPHEFVKPILEKLNLIEYFDGYFGGDYFEEKKPSPLPLLKACEIYKTPIQKAIMIGDSKNDILAGKKANIKTIAVDYGYNQGEDIKTYNPDIIINDFRKLLEVI